ncbi:MAG TPA: glycosyltransferase [Bacillota bacterium]|nr:glycosyltransferase [Bacillota bacterium]
MEYVVSYPQVSVIIPVYNGAAFIDSCLRCLERQNYPKDRMEILVVDNGSTDETRDKAEKYRATVLHCETRGPAAARNVGIKAAKGEILLFTDADCLAAPDWVLNHVLAHGYYQLADASVKVIGGGVAGYNKNLWAVCDDICCWAAIHPALPSRLRVHYHPTANLSIIARILRETGGFFETFITGEDVAFCNKVREMGYHIVFEPSAKVTHINRTSLLKVMMHPLSWSKNSYLLLPAKHQTLLGNPLMRWGGFAWVWGKNTFSTVWYSLKAKRWWFLLLLPFIVINRMFLGYGFLCSANENIKKSRNPHSK